MIASRRRAVLALLVTAAITGSLSDVTGASASSVTPTAAHSIARTFTLNGSGRHVTVSEGKKIRLDLTTRRSGDNIWTITQNPSRSVMRVVSQMPGHNTWLGAYRTYFGLKTVGAGVSTIRLTEHPSGHPHEVNTRFQITVTVPAPKPPAPTPATHSCTRTSSGTCIQGGEFCPQADYGQPGWDAGGREYICKGDSEHPHWELP